jgi:hypothetical protein
VRGISQDSEQEEQVGSALADRTTRADPWTVDASTVTCRSIGATIAASEKTPDLNGHFTKSGLRALLRAG